MAGRYGAVVVFDKSIKRLMGITIPTLRIFLF